MVVVRLHCGGRWGSAWDTIGLIFSFTYAYMFFFGQFGQKKSTAAGVLAKNIVVGGWGGGMLGWVGWWYVGGGMSGVGVV